MFKHTGTVGIWLQIHTWLTTIFKFWEACYKDKIKSVNEDVRLCFKQCIETDTHHNSRNVSPWFIILFFDSSFVFVFFFSFLQTGFDHESEIQRNPVFKIDQIIKSLIMHD